MGLKLKTLELLNSYGIGAEVLRIGVCHDLCSVAITTAIVDLHLDAFVLADWVYQPSAQRKEDPPAQRTISHTTQVVVNTDPSSSPAALNRGPSQMMPEKRKTEITSPVTSTSILTSKTEETRSTQSMTSVLTSTPGNIMHLPHLSLSDASTVSAGSIRAATHEAFEQKRIPVYLQRVTYRPMTRCPLRNSHVSPITKDMLANKIANGRATTDETRQQTNVMLAPPVHRPTVPPSFVPLSVPCHPFRMRTPVIDTLQHVHQTEGRSIDLIGKLYFHDLVDSYHYLQKRLIYISLCYLD